jgi:hypothetical protein
MHFTSIEVAAQRFLYRPSDPRISSMNFEQYLAMELAAEKVQFSPFCHNHLHDLESLWWVAVWMVFYNHFSKGTPSRDCPSFTLRDAGRQLDLAEILFPPESGSVHRQHGFQLSDAFAETFDRLSPNNQIACVGLDFLRENLISHYRVIEAKHYPLVDPNASTDDIYDGFTEVFSYFKSEYHDVVLDYIPDIYAKLSMGEDQPEASSV